MKDEKTTREALAAVVAAAVVAAAVVAAADVDVAVVAADVNDVVRKPHISILETYPNSLMFD